MFAKYFKSLLSGKFAALKVAAVIGTVGLVSAMATPAQAHSHFSIGIGLGFGGFGGYAAPVYCPPPVYYAPAPVVYAPQPAALFIHNRPQRITLLHQRTTHRRPTTRPPLTINSPPMWRRFMPPPFTTPPQSTPPIMAAAVSSSASAAEVITLVATAAAGDITKSFSPGPWAGTCNFQVTQSQQARSQLRACSIFR